MKLPFRLLAWLPPFDRRVWILMMGRLLSQVGTGFVLFYAAVFFVEQVGLSPAAVGLGIGSQSISGTIGRIVGGTLSDSPRWGRRTILLLSAAISALADVVLVLSHDFPTFLAGNLLMGLGIGLYWPATEAVVADLTQPHNRREAYALNRLADSIGLGLGVVFGGWLIAATGLFRLLFVIDGVSFAVFLAVIYFSVPETLNREQAEPRLLQGWVAALRDRPLLIFTLANILFTTYLALLNSALPLYLTQFVSETPAQTFSPTVLSALFAWYIGLCVLGQMPIVRVLRRLAHSQALMVAASLWAVGFGLVWATGQAMQGYALWAGLALAVMAVATVSYNPSASALVIGLAPDALRGVYLSINSLCWAAGYFIGPTLGGWAMGQSRFVADGFWLIAAASVAGVLLILLCLQRQINQVYQNKQRRQF